VSTSRLYLLLLALLVAVGCARAHQDFSKISHSQQRERVAGLISSGWDFKLGRNIHEIKKSLGKPHREEVVNYSNPHVENQMDEIHRLDYGGLVVNVYRVNEKPPRDILYKLVITDNKYKLKWDLKIGSLSSEVIRLFGKPRDARGGLTYSLEEERMNSVKFFFSDDKIKRVQWDWYLD
jgi:hypothetical protein